MNHSFHLPRRRQLLYGGSEGILISHVALDDFWVSARCGELFHNRDSFRLVNPRPGEERQMPSSSLDHPGG